jgi:hypothetical protein
MRGQIVGVVAPELSFSATIAQNYADNVRT